MTLTRGACALPSLGGHAESPWHRVDSSFGSVLRSLLQESIPGGPGFAQYSPGKTDRFGAMTVGRDLSPLNSSTVSGKQVIVTGAAGGIGRAIARSLVVRGARVCAVDVDGDGLDRLSGELAGSQHRVMQYDLSDVTTFDRMIAQVVDHLDGLDGLIHSAAVLHRNPDIFAVTETEWDAQVDLNMKSTFFLNVAAARVMKENGGGSIVNFSSQGWWSGGFDGSVVYNATKGAIVTMSRGLARTFAPHGIRVNSVAPGFVDTPMLRSGLTEDHLEVLRQQVPLGSLGTPDEIAGAAIFLVSDDSSYMTGTTLNVSGGVLMY